MSKKALETFAIEFTAGIKTEQDFSEFSRTLTRTTIGTALNAEPMTAWDTPAIGGPKIPTAAMVQSA